MVDRLKCLLKELKSLSQTEERQLANYFDQFEEIKEDNKQKSYWEQFEPIEAEAEADEFDMDFQDPNKVIFYGI